MLLFHVPGSRSTRVLWTLEEIGRPYDLTRLTWDERKGDEHRRRHPLGKVPAFEFDDGQVLFESVAICLQLADLYPDAGLLPAVGSADRGRVYQWSVFAIAELEKVAFPWNRARRGGEDETETAEKFAPVGEAMRAALAAAGPWIAGEDFSVADISLVSILRNTVELGLLEPGDPLTEYVERGLARPAQLRADAAGAKSD
ncbi:MAG TPA: glutathione S-transferase family protein [Solirubrobacterales bacterium]|nr:glutathione S-transferase family protein [Solirubrobacterales bacterium]